MGFATAAQVEVVAGVGLIVCGLRAAAASAACQLQLPKDG